MKWESDSGDEETDRAKYVWVGILAMLALMIAVIWVISKQSSPNITRAHIQQILVKFDETSSEDRARALEKIGRIRQLIMDGQSFTSVAKKHSEDSYSVKRGGDVGWVEPGLLAEAIDEYAWGGDVGALSDILTTKHGFHIVTIVEREFSKSDQYERDIHQRVFGGKDDRDEAEAAEASEAAEVSVSAESS